MASPLSYPIHSGIFELGAQFSDDQLIQSCPVGLVHRGTLVSVLKLPQGFNLQRHFSFTIKPSLAPMYILGQLHRSLLEKILIVRIFRRSTVAK